MARALPHVQVRGLMTIPPVAAEPHGNLAYFEKMRWLYVDINAKYTIIRWNISQWA